jgi:hypothetical protein
MEVHNQSAAANYNGLNFNNTRSIFQDVNGRIWTIYFGLGINNTQEDQSKTIEILNPVQDKVQTFDQLFGNIAPFKMSQINLIKGDPAYVI